MSDKVGSKKSVSISDRLALSISEAAEALGVSERHLRAHLHELPHVHIGGRVVIPVDACREWLSRSSKSEAEEARKVADELLQGLAK